MRGTLKTPSFVEDITNTSILTSVALRLKSSLLTSRSGVIKKSGQSSKFHTPRSSLPLIHLTWLWRSPELHPLVFIRQSLKGFYQFQALPGHKLWCQLRDTPLFSDWWDDLVWPFRDARSFFSLEVPQASDINAILEESQWTVNSSDVPYGSTCSVLIRWKPTLANTWFWWLHTIYIFLCFDDTVLSTYQ